jgi:hypothetical protein
MNRSDNIKDDCPTNDFTPGSPNGKCWSDGHYMCKKCVHYREDFNRLGQDYIDFVYSLQSGIQISTLIKN